MITFSRIGTMGRFGNQLFQYAALKSLALTKRYDVCLPPIADRVWHSQECLLPYLNIPDRFMLTTSNRVVDESSAYNDSFFDTPDGVDLAGYFQDIRYFLPHLTDLKQYVSVRTDTPPYTAANKIFNDTANRRKHSKIISLHIRLGDNIFMSPQKDTCEGIMLGSPYRNYLSNAIDYFGDADYFVFAGGSRDTKEGQHDRDLNVARQLLSRYNRNFIYSVGNGTLEDFRLMEMCDANILSPFTTFGLWIGYKADQAKPVIVPIDYFMGTEPTLQHRQLYLDHWIRM